MNSVLKLRVCHFSYFTLVTEGALIIFFPRKKRQGALIGAGALNGANTVSISHGFVKNKIYDKQDDFDFVNFPFLDGDVPCSASYGVYISQLIRFARVSSNVDDFNTHNKVLTAKLLRQGY